MAELADAKVSKTFERKLMGVRSPLPAPFQIRYLFSRYSALRGVLDSKLCQFCVSATSGMERRLVQRRRHLETWVRPRLGVSAVPSRRQGLFLIGRLRRT